MTIIKELNYKIVSVNKEIISNSIELRVSDNIEKQMYLIHRALKQQLKNNRIRNANTKTRGEVRGGGKKPWKQKGTGRARAGSNRSPLWRGGGVIFGPKHKLYKCKINKKEKRLAINTIISNKFSQTTIVENILSDYNRPNTKKAINDIKNLGIEIQEQKRILIIVESKTSILRLSFRNIKTIEIIEVNSINILSLLKADTIIMTNKALEKIRQT
uniref:Large ribosomal subunit protein uL4c n=1 Tax=Polysiphonia urceolata TaxID=173545 RepID=A0A1Z1MC53_POLUR|nr:ribosomal protein L4 [Polysiphonia stricta]ARW63560.1 ribosomal protein L4 [Polysiphonia stricta]